MRRIYAWTILPADDGMAIEGVNPHGEPLRLDRVVRVAAETPWPIAVSADGLEWELASIKPIGRPSALSDAANAVAA